MPEQGLFEVLEARMREEDTALRALRDVHRAELEAIKARHRDAEKVAEKNCQEAAAAWRNVLLPLLDLSKRVYTDPTRPNGLESGKASVDATWTEAEVSLKGYWEGVPVLSWHVAIKEPTVLFGPPSYEVSRWHSPDATGEAHRSWERYGMGGSHGV